MEDHLYCTHQLANCDWDEMQLKLQEKYVLIDYEEMLFEKQFLLRQGSSSVDKYANKFHELNLHSFVS